MLTRLPSRRRCASRMEPLVDAAPDAADDAVADVQQVGVVLERHARQIELALLLDVNLLGSVDHDFGDGIVLEQRLEGSRGPSCRSRSGRRNPACSGRLSWIRSSPSSSPTTPSSWRTSSLRGRLTAAAARSMRPMTSGCTARRACSTLLRDRPLADFSEPSVLAAWVCHDVDVAAIAAFISTTGTAGAATSGDAAGANLRGGFRRLFFRRRAVDRGAGVGALKFVAGRTGRRTSAT